METKIDLTRMQKLLNGMEDDAIPTTIAQDTEYNDTNIKCIANMADREGRVSCDNTQSNDNINMDMDMQDICYILNIKGRIGGYSNIVNAHNITSEIFDNISISDLQNAKGVMITFGINPNVSMFDIGNFMEKLEELLIGNPDIMFGTITDTNLPTDKIDIKIILTGL